MKNKKETKKKVTFYLPDFVYEDIKRTSKMRRLTYSTIATSIFIRGLNQSENEEIIDRRLNRLQRQYERMHQDHQILTETLAAFVKNYLAHMPIVSLEQRAETERLGDQRFEEFLSLVQDAFKEGQLFADLVKEKIFAKEDFKDEEAQ